MKPWRAKAQLARAQLSKLEPGSQLSVETIWGGELEILSDKMCPASTKSPACGDATKVKNGEAVASWSLRGGVSS